MTREPAEATIPFPSDFQVPHLFRLLQARAHEKAEVGAGRNIARSQFHEFGGEIGAARQSAHAHMFAVLAARCDGAHESLAYARIVVLPRYARFRRRVPTPRPARSARSRAGRRTRSRITT